MDAQGERRGALPRQSRWGGGLRASPRGFQEAGIRPGSGRLRDAVNILISKLTGLLPPTTLDPAPHPRATGNPETGQDRSYGALCRNQAPSGSVAAVALEGAQDPVLRMVKMPGQCPWHRQLGRGHRWTKGRTPSGLCANTAGGHQGLCLSTVCAGPFLSLVGSRAVPPSPVNCPSPWPPKPQTWPPSWDLPANALPGSPRPRPAPSGGGGTGQRPKLWALIPGFHVLNMFLVYFTHFFAFTFSNHFISDVLITVFFFFLTLIALQV